MQYVRGIHVYILIDVESLNIRDMMTNNSDTFPLIHSGPFIYHKRDIVDETNPIFYFQDKTNSKNKSDIDVLSRPCLVLISQLHPNLLGALCRPVASIRRG